ncbi:MAG: hypothetical protein IKS64_06690, partial [Muribaculaceae bacterium]|nr:hypothetical protein [Muribaculaceae bacterium]
PITILVHDPRTIFCVSHEKGVPFNKLGGASATKIKIFVFHFVFELNALVRKALSKFCFFSLNRIFLSVCTNFG